MIIFLNKIDTFSAEESLRGEKIEEALLMLEPYKKKFGFEICPMSALTGEGLLDAFDTILNLLESDDMLQKFKLRITHSITLDDAQLTQEITKLRKENKGCC